MGAFERFFHKEFAKELAEVAVKKRAEGRAEIRRFFRDYLVKIGIPPEDFDEYKKLIADEKKLETKGCK